MTSEASMKILLDEKLKKSRELAEKQKRLREREEKREAKKKEVEEKKKLREQKKTRKNGRKRNAGKKVQQELEYDENTCKVCLAQYMPTDDEDLPWVMCDGCNMWMHIECIPFGVDITPIDNDQQFFCHDCI